MSYSTDRYYGPVSIHITATRDKLDRDENAESDEKLKAWCCTVVVRRQEPATAVPGAGSSDLR